MYVWCKRETRFARRRTSRRGLRTGKGAQLFAVRMGELEGLAEEGWDVVQNLLKGGGRSPKEDG